MKLKKYIKNSFFKGKKILSFELLKEQGLCNKIFKVKCKNKDYLLRVFKKEKHSYISRKQEYKLQKKLSKKDLAAEVYYLNKKFMVCEYINGVHKKNLNKKELITLSNQLLKLHKIKTKSKSYKFKKDLLEYKQVLKDKNSKKIIQRSLKLLKELKAYPFEAVLCHHDLNQRNILFYKNKVKFIDWEFSCKNDKFFDLANICIEFNLNKKEEKIFLKNYLKKIKKQDLNKLNLYKNLYKNLWQLWFTRYIN